MILILKLLLAHLIGDFFLQPQKWVKHKEKHKLKSVWLYVHVAVHLALMFLFIWDLSYTPLILGIGLLHLIIDSFKLILQQKNNKRIFFFIDQILHIATIIGLPALFYSKTYNFEFIPNDQLLLLIICIAFLTTPASIIMKIIFSKWNIAKLTKDNESLKDAGKYIGILERLLVFTFIVVGQWEAVGFLITAKSVFRFGDLTASKERKLTEYILIGTLISFGIAIVISLLYLNFRLYV
ncbi:uncharacterized protein DUF3307 [Winogradskyella epiphytica]|uniref:Uncharacterized protein DUF3307 n=1 Tax=Winogradskyella epiphytica TaxID=262005 RepID=A0A2V4YD17_9FLAO|nr:DUF3307 domain-containing protein [Winogradskyella epiphytica]PYE81107.1 uncharacterized protein DUF3307 [Winogradskyella epiphytica]GGW66906.1 membrane protein [Winogradskyella epiphytica]